MRFTKHKPWNLDKGLAIIMVMLGMQMKGAFFPRLNIIFPKTAMLFNVEMVEGLF